MTATDYPTALATATTGWRVRRQGWGEDSFVVVSHGKLIASVGGDLSPEVPATDVDAIDWEPLPYIVVGEWKDPEWVLLSKSTTRPLTAEELRRVCAGPRRHPFGQEAVQIMRGGDVLVYPNAEAANAVEVGSDA